MTTLTVLPENYAIALKLIDEAHAQDPNTTPGPDGGPIPYELHYAQEMTRWLAIHTPDASPALQLACRAQHFRRWELPRSSYPKTRSGYLMWRAKAKSLAAQHLTTLLSSPAITPPIPESEIEYIASLVRKEGLRATSTKPRDSIETAPSQQEIDAQAVEDVACLVFLTQQFESYSTTGNGAAIDDDKWVNILRKTWAKMGERGRELALGVVEALGERGKRLVVRAVSGDEKGEN